MNLIGLTRRDTGPSFFSGQERIGMILLIALATVAISSLVIVLLFHRRNLSLQTQMAPSGSPDHQLHLKGTETTDKPIIHDLYIGRRTDIHDASWGSSMVSGHDLPPYI